MIIGFNSSDEKYGVFAPSALCELEHDGYTFKSSEQAFLYSVAELFDASNIAELIADGEYLYSFRHVISMLGMVNAGIFDSHKYRMMYEVTYEKISQNIELKELLLSTGSIPLFYASDDDFVWGCGMDADNPDFGKPDACKGDNLLGEILMEIRDDFRDNNWDEEIPDEVLSLIKMGVPIYDEDSIDMLNDILEPDDFPDYLN